MSKLTTFYELTQAETNNLTSHSDEICVGKKEENLVNNLAELIKKLYIKSSAKARA